MTETKNPLEGLEPHQYPLIYLPPFTKPFLPKEQEGGGLKVYDAITAAVRKSKIPLMNLHEIPKNYTIGDVVRECLIANSMYCDAVEDKVPDEIVAQLSGPVYETLLAKPSTQTAYHIMDMIRYTELAVGGITIGALGRLGAKQLSEPYEVKGFKMNAIDKLLVINGVFDASWLMVYSVARHGTYEGSADLPALQKAQALLRNIMHAGKEIITEPFHNKFERRIWDRWFMLNIAGIVPLSILRTGRPVSELHAMGDQIGGAIKDLVHGYSKELLGELKGPHPMLERIKEKHPIIYSQLSNAEHGLEGILNSASTLAEDQNAQVVHDHTTGQTASRVDATTPEKLVELTDRSRKAGNIEATVMHHRNQFHGSLFKMIHDRSTDVLAIGGHILTGIEVTKHIAVGYKDLARASLTYSAARDVLKATQGE